MANILLITNIYPNNDPKYDGTPVCHSFTKEWKSMGHDVRVVHFDSLFPKLYYWVNEIFHDKIQAKTGCVAYSNTPRTISNYEVDGIPVTFVPLRKLIPHKSPSKRIALRAFDDVCRELMKIGFVPDVVTAHFAVPQLEMLYYFKQRYPNIQTCMVLHGNGSQIPSNYPKEYKTYMDSVDVWGFRSVAFKDQFEERFGKQDHEFLCYSGVPEKYLVSVNRDYSKGVKHFAFVGSLYELKNVDVTLRALKKAMNGKAYHFDIVGSGAENDNLHHLVEELEMQDQVTFYGQQPRDKAQEIVAQADCFVMVSTREAFGLVYVEAMAKGCIAVATKGQGFDGIIVDGENGFLCPSRDVDALAETITRIVSLSEIERKSISEKAILTANELTDRKVAEKYLYSII